MKLKQPRLSEGAFRREKFFQDIEKNLDLKVVDIEKSYNREDNDITGSELYHYVAILEEGQEIVFWTNADTGMVEDIYFKLDSAKADQRVVAKVYKQGEKIKLSSKALAREINRLAKVAKKRKKNRTFRKNDITKVINEVNSSNIDNKPFLELEKQLTKGSGYFIVVDESGMYLSVNGTATSINSEIRTFKTKDEAVDAMVALENSKVVEI